MRLLPNNHIDVCVIEPGAYATGFNKENNEKKYTWMGKNSYFYPILNSLKKIEEKVWNFIEIKPFHSIIRKYIKTVETPHLRHRYMAPWYQSMFIQLGRIFRNVTIFFFTFVIFHNNPMEIPFQSLQSICIWGYVCYQI